MKKFVLCAFAAAAVMLMASCAAAGEKTAQTSTPAVSAAASTETYSTPASTEEYMSWTKKEWDAATDAEKRNCMRTLVKVVMGYSTHQVEAMDSKAIDGRLDAIGTEIEALYKQGYGDKTMAELAFIISGSTTESETTPATAKNIESSKYLGWNAADWVVADEDTQRDCALLVLRYVAVKNGRDASAITEASVTTDGLNEIVEKINQMFAGDNVDKDTTIKTLIERGLK